MFNPIVEKITNILLQKNQSDDAEFFRALANFYVVKLASMMRVQVQTHDRGVIPVNAYTIALGYSGVGKNASVTFIENELLSEFKNRFINETLPLSVEHNIHNLATDISIRNKTDLEDEKEKLLEQYNATGSYLFSYDSSTVPALRQMRQKLLLANIGSMNMLVDELGSNIQNIQEPLVTYLTAYDKGIFKDKLLKSTKEHQRFYEIDGITPTNMLLFGTPSRLFDGDKTEEIFNDLLLTGYARRCFFALSKPVNHKLELSPEELYEQTKDSNYAKDIDELKKLFTELAEFPRTNTVITMDKSIAIRLIEYRQNCIAKAEDIPEHDEMQRAELIHRYFRVIKLLGAYAFMDKVTECTTDHIEQAINYTEESGKAFSKIVNRPSNYQRLAEYLANVKDEVTHIDLMDSLPFYKGSEANRRELLNLAIAFGYKNNIIIKSKIVDNIEFLKGESLPTTNIEKILLTYSESLSENYKPAEVSIEHLERLFKKDKYNFCNHKFVDNHRKEENAYDYFNMVVFDIDGTAKIPFVLSVLQEYEFIIYTTKSHSEDSHRFRLVMPISHHLTLSDTLYKQYMTNIYEWLPFKVDTQTNQRSRKWATNSNCKVYRNKGSLLDALQFIPNTKKNDERIVTENSYIDFSNLERWFMRNIKKGTNTNNMLCRYAFMLVDSGYSIEDIRQKVLNFNKKLKHPLDESEIYRTIFISVANKLNKKDGEK